MFSNLLRGNRAGKRISTVIRPSKCYGKHNRIFLKSKKCIPKHTSHLSRILYPKEVAVMKRGIRVCLAIIFIWTIIPLFYACDSGQATYIKYDVIAEYDPAHNTVTGVVKLTFENPTDNEIDTLKLQLYPNAYRENALYSCVSEAEEQLAYYDKKSYGGVAITSVSGAKNWEVSGEDENILSVTLLYSVFPNENAVLDVGYIVTLPIINHRLGIGETAVHLGRFFPTLCGIRKGAFEESTPTAFGEPYAQAVADYKVTFTTPKEYQALSSCQKVALQALESKTEHRFVGDDIRNFGLVLYTQRKLSKISVGNCTLSYVYEKDDNAEDTLRLLKEAFTYCQNKFGSYPYPALTIFQTAQSGDAYGYTALATLSNRLMGKELYCEMAKQVAKQWFGEMVGVDALNNAWQSDGVAEYIALDFLGGDRQYGVDKEKAVANCLKEYRSYYDIYGNVLDRTDTKMNKPLKEFINEYEYHCINVDKAVIMLDTLQKSIGRRRFFAGLKRYCTGYTFCQTGVGELVGAFEKHGADVQGFFDGFLQGKVIL